MFWHKIDIKVQVWNIVTSPCLASYSHSLCLINGVMDHVGVEPFVRHKLNGDWKMTGLADSSRLPTKEEMMNMD